MISIRTLKVYECCKGATEKDIHISRQTEPQERWQLIEAACSFRTEGVQAETTEVAHVAFQKDQIRWAGCIFWDGLIDKLFFFLGMSLTVFHVFPYWFLLLGELRVSCGWFLEPVFLQKIDGWVDAPTFDISIDPGTKLAWNLMDDPYPIHRVWGCKLDLSTLKVAELEPKSFYVT